MRRPLRYLCLAGVVGAASLGLTACNGSPPAATVGGRVLSVSAFNHQLTQWTADADLVQELNQSAAQSAGQSGGQAQTVVGQGSGTYSTSFVDGVLERNIEVMALEEYLAGRGITPSADQTVAARAYFEADGGPAWFDLAEPVRQLFLDQLLTEAELTPAPSDPSSLASDYSQIQPWAFSSVCVIEADAPDLPAAEGVVSSGQVNGTRVCYDQQQLEAEPAGVQDAIVGLSAPGQISKPVRTSFGYAVFELSSRSSPGLDAGVAQVLTAAQNPPSSLGGIIDGTRIVVNPMYGTWQQGCLVPPGQSAQQACGSQQ